MMMAPNEKHIIMSLGRVCVFELCFKYYIYQKCHLCMMGPKASALLMDGI